MSEAGPSLTVEDLNDAFTEEAGFDTCGMLTDDIVLSVEEQLNPVPALEILDEVIEVPRIVITHAQGLKHVGDLEHYAISSDGDDSQGLHAAILRVQYLMMRRYPKKKQSKMHQYFS